jgi:hypothetical protein
MTDRGSDDELFSNEGAALPSRWLLKTPLPLKRVRLLDVCARRAESFVSAQGVSFYRAAGAPNPWPATVTVPETLHTWPRPAPADAHSRPAKE